jgi:DNA repair protein RadC
VARRGLAEASNAGLLAPVTNISDEKDEPHYHGHRERLRQRFLEGGADALPDYELLELILFAIPRKDTKKLAKDLIAEFGSFQEVISADAATLATFKGVGETGAAMLKAVQAAAQRLLRPEMNEAEVISSWGALIGYLTVKAAYEPIEQFRVLYLDRKNKLILDEPLGKGTVDHTPVYPREVVKRALELNASAVIMCHNHPSGDPKPSRADIDMTRKVKDALGAVSITLHDHVVVSRGGHVSFKSEGLL